MPRFKDVDHSPRFLAVDLSRQLIHGTFQHALHHLLDCEIDLTEIEARYRNDEVGASPYELRVLLKIVLFAYARGIISSRSIEAARRSNVQFIALSGDSQPHYSTLRGLTLRPTGRADTRLLLGERRRGPPVS
ncbi:MAG: transposase [Pyrinomonadaceae bacterium]|nr:transposase [Gammaproteobacteria bacterium]MBA3572852.1 transposase [Pyrinomonadaceae bacterium]